MIHDEDLKNSLDYSEGQKEAAHRVLVELINLFMEYKDDIRVVGGWVPDLMFPGEGHIGSVDVDVLIKHYRGGVMKLAEEFSTCADRNIIKEMIEKLEGKFASGNHAGPVDVVNFEDILDEEEAEVIRRDAYEQVQALLRGIRNSTLIPREKE